MKTQEYQPGIELSPNFELCLVEGEEGYVDSLDFKEFYEFYVCFDLGLKDKYGLSDLLIIKVSKEQWNNIYGGLEYEVEQLPEGVDKQFADKVLNKDESQKIVIDAIYELVDKYESQGFDN